MLRLSKKADYALIAMKHLATRSDGGASSAREIAEQYDIPLELMAKVLQRLARRGLVVSLQGTRGGYRLARQSCGQYAKCSVRDPLWRIKDRIVSALADCTLQEIATDSLAEPPMPMAFNTGRNTAKL
jgi:DNA-binding IscR family transcriptional regulator